MFAPKSPTKSKLYQIRMTEAMFMELADLSKSRKIPKQEMIRQMIQYGMDELRKAIKGRKT